MNDSPAAGHTLKQDAIGRIALIAEGDARRIRREPLRAAFGLRWLARVVAGNEARALRRLAALDGLPRLLAWDGRVLERSYFDGQPMQHGRPRDPVYFHAARRLLHAVHRQGVVHNDLAKEANWLVTASGAPAIIDFQLAWCPRRPGRLFRLLAREDLRHLLKHKRTYCAERLTPVERRLLARRSWLRELWFATGKRVYRLVTRRLLRWEDNEGRGAQAALPRDRSD
jgi:RIO-like serine/threonine protein kinase